MLRAILNKSWKQHPTKQQLYSNLPPILKTIQVIRTKHAGEARRNLCDIFLWTATHGHVIVSQPTRTYLDQLSADKGCNLENLPRAIDYKNGRRERERERESKRNPCCQRDLMIMMMVIMMIEWSSNKSFKLNLFSYNTFCIVAIDFPKEKRWFSLIAKRFSSSHSFI